MSSRKDPPRSRPGSGEGSDSGPYHESQYYPQYQSAPPQQHMHQYPPGYPMRPPHGYPYPGHYGPPGMMGPDHTASSPQQGFHPPLHRYPGPAGSNMTAVTPDSGQIMPAEFMSPPSNMKRRTMTPGSSLSPSKRARSGAFFFSSYPFQGGSFFPLRVQVILRCPDFRAST